VRRDRFVPVLDDLEGRRRPGWELEWHNAYADLYSVAGPAGAVNARVGRFYLPLGLNLQTDTHGTVLQLSNEQNLGYERDWYAGLWGAASEGLAYDAYYMLGSGHRPEFRGQQGLAGARLSLGSVFAYERGLEGGLAALAGERLSEEGARVGTRRYGVDARLRRPVPTGSASALLEVNAGADDGRGVVMQLYQAEYLRASRRWGLAAQYRRRWQDGVGADGSAIGELSWYLRNDPGNSDLHWIKLNVERRIEKATARGDTVLAAQYYRYW
jgi:hypothetical protein